MNLRKVGKGLSATWKALGQGKRKLRQALWWPMSSAKHFVGTLGVAALGLVGWQALKNSDMMKGTTTFDRVALAEKSALDLKNQGDGTVTSENTLRPSIVDTVDGNFIAVCPGDKGDTTYIYAPVEGYDKSNTSDQYKKEGGYRVASRMNQDSVFQVQHAIKSELGLSYDRNPEMEFKLNTPMMTENNRQTARTTFNAFGGNAVEIYLAEKPTISKEKPEFMKNPGVSKRLGL